MNLDEILVWKGTALWVVGPPNKARAVGEVLKDEGLINSYAVFVRGARKHTLNTLEAARKQLEAYA